MNFLERLDDGLQDQLISVGRSRAYPARSIVFFEGDVGRDVLLVRAGQLKVSISIEDREVVLDVIDPGDIVGEIAAI